MKYHRSRGGEKTRGGQGVRVTPETLSCGAVIRVGDAVQAFRAEFEAFTEGACWVALGGVRDADAGEVNARSCNGYLAPSKRVASGGFIGQAQVDGSDRRTVRFAEGSTLETTLLLPDEFDMLAINCFAFEDKWQWVFVKNSDLPRSTYRKYTPVQQSNLLASLVTVTLPVSGAFTTDLFELLDQLISQRA